MSLIHTAELNGIAPFDYLVTLQRHAQAVARDPSAWLPWYYVGGHVNPREFDAWPGSP
jgi:hypothetical protein